MFIHLFVFMSIYLIYFRSFEIICFAIPKNRGFEVGEGNRENAEYMSLARKIIMQNKSK